MFSIFYASVNSKPDHPPPLATPGDSHILVAPGVRFSFFCLARGLPRMVLNQSKSSIILKKRAIFTLSLKQLSSSSFLMFIYAKREQCDSGSIWQGTRIYPGKLKPVLVKLKFHLIQYVNMANMPKKTKLYSRFLLLRIYPDSPVHMSANMERIQICPVML